MSTPVTDASGERWASIRAISPVPVPMSSIRRSEGRTPAQAPNRTPSVPTFIGQRSWRIVNCLKLKITLNF